MSQNSEYLQLSHQTKLNRFPKIFETAKRLKPNPKRILSFGCSYGDECFTIADLFPDSQIIGVDIDHGCISQARRKNSSNRIFFHDDLGATGKYDLIFCLMVLFSLEKPISETLFQSAIKLINKHAENDAVIAIYTSDYDPMTMAEIVNEWEIINQFKRIHPRNKKEYYCGYYRKKCL